MQRHFEHGYTLIEAMIVISIIALVALAGSPLSGSWSKDAKLETTKGALSEGFARAKSLALRNQNGAVGNAAAAAVCFGANDTMTVLQYNGTSAVNCTGPVGNQIWQSDLNEDVSIFEVTAGTASTTELACICFNNKGLVDKTNCSTCAAASTFQFTTGSTDETASFF